MFDFRTTQTRQIQIDIQEETRRNSDNLDLEAADRSSNKVLMLFKRTFTENTQVCYREKTQYLRRKAGICPSLWCVFTTEVPSL